MWPSTASCGFPGCLERTFSPLNSQPPADAALPVQKLRVRSRQPCVHRSPSPVRSKSKTELRVVVELWKCQPTLPPYVPARSPVAPHPPTAHLNCFVLFKCGPLKVPQVPKHGTQCDRRMFHFLQRIDLEPAGRFIAICIVAFGQKKCFYVAAPQVATGEEKWLRWSGRVFLNVDDALKIYKLF